jgi:diguanylate cyclase (GGDEF)-like protein/PAS domain S-box-containing protein
MSLNLLKEKDVTIALLTTIAIFMVDLLAPSWYDAWVLYLVPLFFMYRSARLSYAYSVVVTLLIVTGLFLHPDSTSSMHSAINRITGIFGGWGVSVLLMRLKHLHVSLRQSHNELEKRFTDLKKLQDLLSQGKKEWEETFDSINDAITIHDRDFNVIRANKAAEKILGLPFLEILGQKCYRLYHGSDCLPDDCPSCMALKTGKPHVVEKFDPYLNKHIEIKTFPLFEDNQVIKVVHIVRDITERKRVEETLRDSEEKYRLLFENMLAGFAHCKMLFEYNRPQDFICLDVNSAFERLTGLKNVVGRKVTEVIPGIKEAYPELFEIFGRVALTGKPERVEIYFEPLRMWFSISVHSSKKEFFIAVFDNVTERKKMEEFLQHQAYHDNLTGLPNRLLFMEHVSLGLIHARRNRNMAAILFMDLDHFKYINDTLGHTAGDDLLKDIAGRLKTCIRESDMVARMGGDEFIVLLSDITVAEDAAIVGRKIMASLLEPFFINSHKVNTTASIGISIYPDDGENEEDLLKNADIAMYHAKKQGRNTYQFYNTAMNCKNPMCP